MLKHVIVDGSNIATEGRSKPSLKQLHEAVLAFLEEHPKAAITVIVDATFGHRIDPKEVPAFNKAVEHNELVTPPAGTVGRGDAFVLNIAEKAGASILSNDSYQEFHGDYKWLFDEGRLIGGKPVPHVGWVFVERLPVRGEKSRMSERKSKAVASGGRGERGARKVSAAAMKPMPVPKSPPPGATMSAKKSDVGAAQSKRSDSSKGLNEILPFLHFVENHGVGSIVEGVVESYSSHGAYVQIGEIKGYVPLRMLGDPPPRSARDAMKLGEKVALEIVEIVGGRRSVNLKPSGRAGARSQSGKSQSGKPTAKKSASSNASPAKSGSGTKGTVKKVIARKSAPAKTPVKKAPVKKVPAKTPVKKAPVKTVPVKKSVAKVPVKKAPAKTPVKKAPDKTAAKRSVAKVQAKKVPVKKVQATKVSARKSSPAK